MAVGKKTGGRKKGTPNRKPKLLQEKAAAFGMTPLDVMLMAMKKHVDEKEWDQAAAIAKDAAPYLHPRLSSMQVQAEVTSEATQIVEFLVTTREQANQAIADLTAAAGVPRQ